MDKKTQGQMEKRHVDTGTKIYTKTQTDKQKDTLTHRQTYKKTHRQDKKHRQAEKRRIDTKADGETHKKKKQIDTQTET